MDTHFMRFGTDGIRGTYGAGLDARLAYAAGLAAAAVIGGGKVLLAMDTRESGGEIAGAVRDGLLAGGTDVLFLGILPTPAVAYLTTKFGCAAGVMVTASHNPPEYNGIKFFGGGGLKLSEKEEQQIEYYIDNPPSKTFRGKTETSDAGGLYIEQLCKAAGSLYGISVVLDCGHGAVFALAGEFFRSCGAKVKTIANTPDGTRINLGCGALFPEFAADYTKTKYDLGLSFDGDGDRLSVSAGGAVISGDSVLYNLSELTKAETVVGTVLTNSALEKKLIEKNKRLLRTPVGDKYISRLMHEKGYTLGGEQSGHYIIRPYSLTGDALLAAGLTAKYIASGHILERLQLVPQRDISKFALSGRIDCTDIKSLIDSANLRMKDKGRLVVRMSGTEPKMRIMAESFDTNLIDEILSEFDYILK